MKLFVTEYTVRLHIWYYITRRIVYLCGAVTDKIWCTDNQLRDHKTTINQVLGTQTITAGTGIETFGKRIVWENYTTE